MSEGFQYDDREGDESGGSWLKNQGPSTSGGDDLALHASQRSRKPHAYIDNHVMPAYAELRLKSGFGEVSFGGIGETTGRLPTSCRLESQQRMVGSRKSSGGRFEDEGGTDGGRMNIDVMQARSRPGRSKGNKAMFLVALASWCCSVEEPNDVSAMERSTS